MDNSVNAGITTALATIPTFIGSHVAEVGAAALAAAGLVFAVRWLRRLVK
jgi:hypothetical protein